MESIRRDKITVLFDDGEFFTYKTSVKAFNETIVIDSEIREDQTAYIKAGDFLLVQTKGSEAMQKGMCTDLTFGCTTLAHFIISSIIINAFNQYVCLQFQRVCEIDFFFQFSLTGVVDAVGKVFLTVTLFAEKVKKRIRKRSAGLRLFDKNMPNETDKGLFLSSTYMKSSSNLMLCNVLHSVHNEVIVDMK